MERFTVEEFHSNFDNLLDRIESGESFMIYSEHGNVMIVPCNKYKEADDIIRIHTDHEEGS